MLLASASRDQLVHVFDSSADFALQQTTHEHTGAVTGLRFAADATSTRSCQLMTCSADKTVVFHRAGQDKGRAAVSLQHQTESGGTLYDLCTTHDGRYAVTAGGDCSIKVWDTKTGALVRTIASDPKAEPVRVALDPSDTLMAVAGSDRGIRLYDFKSGVLQYKVRG